MTQKIRPRPQKHNGLSHWKRWERRRVMALAVRQGQDIDEVARTFSVTENLVRTSCKEFRVVVPIASNPRMKRSTFKIIAQLQGGKFTQSDIARKFKVSRQFISQIAASCKRTGIKIAT